MTQASFQQSSAQKEIQRIIDKYRKWSEKLGRAGHIVGGEKLRDGQGRVMRGTAPKTVITDGPYSEVKEIVGGYYVIEARGYDEALRLAADSPHLEFGTIELREVEPT